MWVSIAGGERLGMGAIEDTYGLIFRPAKPAPLPFTYTASPRDGERLLEGAWHPGSACQHEAAAGWGWQ